MATSPQYASTPFSPAVLVSAANPNRDGTGTVVLLSGPQVTGCRIDDIKISAQGTTTAGMIRFFRRRGASLFLLAEFPVTGKVPSATVEAFALTLNNLAWVMDPTSELLVSTEKAEVFAICVTRGGIL